MFECTRTNPFVGAASPILDKHDTQFSEGGDLDARRPLNGLAVLTAQEKQVAGDAKEGQQLPNNGGQKETVVEKTEPPLNHEKRVSAGLRADEDKEILRDDLGEDGSGLGEGEDAGSAGATKGAMSHTWGGVREMATKRCLEMGAGTDWNGIKYSIYIQLELFKS